MCPLGTKWFSQKCCLTSYTIGGSSEVDPQPKLQHQTDTRAEFGLNAFSEPWIESTPYTIVSALNMSNMF